MPANDTIDYTCKVCGYHNIWTRDQILQLGKKEIYRDGELEEYTLTCKNPQLTVECSGRHKVGLPRKA